MDDEDSSSNPFRKIESCSTTIDTMDLDLDLDLTTCFKLPKQSLQRAIRFQPKAKIKPKSMMTGSQYFSNTSMDDDCTEKTTGKDLEDDKVQREIDVFFSPMLDATTQLYVMQYPLRTCWRPYELSQRCQEIRINSKEHKLEIDLALDVDSKNYDKEVSTSLRLTKQTLSCEVFPITSHAVGCLLGDKLYLCPVQVLAQFRPSMRHLEEGISSTISSSDESNEALRKHAWATLEYHGSESEISSRYKQKMTAFEGSSIEFSMSLCDYVDSLCTGTSVGNKGLSRRLLLSLSLEERLKTLLCKGGPFLRHSSILNLAPDHSVEDVLNVLQKYAYLVQGLWVAKSSLCYEGVHQHARDYILLLFSKKKEISYSQLRSPKIPLEIFRNILNPLAIERPAFKEWKFKEPMDESFGKAYPEILEKQNQAWLSREKCIMATVHEVVNKYSTQIEKKVLDRPLNVNRMMSDSTRDALPRALLEVFRTYKVCSLQLIRDGLRDMASLKASIPKARSRALINAGYGASAPLSELEPFIKKIAINIHNVYVLKSLDIPTLDPLRNVVINLLRSKGPNARICKADVVEASKIALQREICNSEYEQVMNELCVSNRAGGWTLKSGQGDLI